MKKFILLFISLITICNSSYGQLTLSSVEGLSYSRDLNYTNPVGNFSETRKVGLCYGKIGNPYTGADACFYSYDITKMPDNCMPNFDYVDDSTTSASANVIYIVYNYYPGKNPGVGQLSNLNNETAAIQAAIWHYTNGFNVNSITNNNTVKNRALAIIAAADLNGASWSVPTVLKIVPDADPDFFYIQTTKDNGSGLAVTNISLSITQGSLSANTVNTNAGGISPVVEVMNTNNGTITAIANNITLPKGILFRNISNSCPKVILACNGPGTLKATADWGALPVEMASFTSIVNGRNAELNWSTVSEINNSGFEIERTSSENNWKKIGFVSGNGNSDVTKNYSFNDNNLTTGRYSYRLKQLDFNGNFEYFNLSSDVNIGVPETFKVSQNYPNPFNPSTKINYDLPFDGNVSVKIFDMSGKELFTILNQNQTAGYYSFNFNGSSLSTGAYFYRISAAGNSQNYVMTKKMMLIK